jgi:RNA polymerase sigma factor (sigma-70 family)
LAAVNAAGRAVGLEPLQPHEHLEGDTLARELYERHARRVLAYCRSRLRRLEDAEDAVQTTFLHAVRNLRRGDTPAHDLAWLLGIARNVCLSRVETAGRRGRLELVCDPVDLERTEALPGRRDELIGLEDALARLPEQQRRAVLLRDWRGLSYEEVASQLGVSLANAETLIFRGRRELAALLQEQPSATRRRLASLGNLGSLVSWAKAGFGGAAAASKLAAAAAVVAVTGAGIATGTGVIGSERPTATPPKTARVVPASASALTPRVSVPAAAPTRERPSVPRPAQASRPAPTRSATPIAPPATVPTPTAAPTTASAPAPAAATPTTPGPTGAAPPSGPRPAPTAPAPKAAAPPVVTVKPEQVVPAVTDTVGTTVTTVGQTVEQLVPVLAPVTTPVTQTVVEVVESVPQVTEAINPVVEPVVAALPTVTVTPPPLLPIGPITVDPKKLLP